MSLVYPICNPSRRAALKPAQQIFLRSPSGAGQTQPMFQRPFLWRAAPRTLLALSLWFDGGLLAGAVGAADLAVCRARDCTNNPLEATRYQARISADRAADDLSAKYMQTFLGVYILRYNHPNTGQHAFHYDSGLGF